MCTIIIDSTPFSYFLRPISMICARSNIMMCDSQQTCTPYRDQILPPIVFVILKFASVCFSTPPSTSLPPPHFIIYLLNNIHQKIENVSSLNSFSNIFLLKCPAFVVL
mmetsp:Transcript_13510/g.17745  ORF Transcript_13510/g.17745 Transcript_13510/m.17745 type:complete len:108 (-) Transcript_13510:1688-2011(-)